MRASITRNARLGMVCAGATPGASQVEPPRGGTPDAAVTDMMKYLTSVILVAGCLHSRPVEYTGTVRVTSPALVSINPDVKVVADADEPLFFSRGAYWLFHDGRWYRSDRIGNSWIQIATPPVPVVQIDQPYAYTRFQRDRAAQTAVADEQQQEQQPEPEQAQKRRNQKMLDFDR
jgi:hypothetical protein